MLLKEKRQTTKNPIEHPEEGAAEDPTDSKQREEVSGTQIY